MIDCAVVIPVYNAAAFVACAVASAMAQPQTAELILVEDGSRDDSLAVCRRLAQSDPRIHLCTHADGRNHGPAASRNLGIRRATRPWIAFLDADDYFLPQRFETSALRVGRDTTLDGIYEAVGTHFETTEARRRWIASGAPQLTTMAAGVPPEALFESMAPLGSGGGIHLDGCVVKRSALQRARLFDPDLYLHQDTALLIRLAVVGRLDAGRLDGPVAMRRVHGANRITAPRSPRRRFGERMRMWRGLRRWARPRLTATRYDRLLGCYLTEAVTIGRAIYPTWPAGPAKARALMRLAAQTPTMTLERRFWRKLAAVLIYPGPAPDAAVCR